MRREREGEREREGGREGERERERKQVRGRARTPSLTHTRSLSLVLVHSALTHSLSHSALTRSLTLTRLPFKPTFSLDSSERLWTLADASGFFSTLVDASGHPWRDCRLILSQVMVTFWIPPKLFDTAGKPLDALGQIMTRERFWMLPDVWMPLAPEIDGDERARASGCFLTPLGCL